VPPQANGYLTHGEKEKEKEKKEKEKKKRKEKKKILSFSSFLAFPLSFFPCFFFFHV
jgi:hypothetical protein